jgi:hypothetical protein
VRDTAFKRVIMGLDSSGQSVAASIGLLEAIECESTQAHSEDTLWAADSWVAGHALDRIFTGPEQEAWELEPLQEGSSSGLSTFQRTVPDNCTRPT